MLFTVKRRARGALGLAALLGGLAVVLRAVGGLSWSLRVTSESLLLGGLGLLALLLVDAIGHVAFEARWGDHYLAVYGAFVEYFDGQSRGAILAGGLLAASEELLFRGVLLQGLIELTAVPIGISIVVTGLLFGAAHYARGETIAVFTVWAAWEGVLLGCLYVLSGSLIVPVVAHVAHDIGGFGLLAWQREYGLLTLSDGGRADPDGRR